MAKLTISKVDIAMNKNFMTKLEMIELTMIK
jgi:hypothetical protein